MESIKNRQLIVDLLNQDLQGEHGAIIQYLYHAWTLDLPGISSSLESIAREEMYHFQWLAQRIVEYGGSPSISRYPVYLEAPSFRELISLDSRAEDEAIKQYKEHIDQIEDPRTIRLIERIISDERRHRTRFLQLAEQVAELKEDTTAERSPEAEARRQKLIEMLNSGVRHEYTVILQYLHQAYTASDRSLGHAMEQSAIVEMKHMGWLAEHVAEMGGKPAVDRNKIILAEKDKEMIEADLVDEEKAVELYEQQIGQIDDEEVKELLRVIREHEIYHLDELKHFLNRLKEASSDGMNGDGKSNRRSLTIGSLIEEK